MTKCSNAKVIPLIDSSSNEDFGEAKIYFCNESDQIYIQNIELVSNDVSSLAALKALSYVINSLFSDQFKTATSFPMFDQQLLSDIYTQAGFNRTGLFMRRSFIDEEGRVLFKALSRDSLEGFLERLEKINSKNIAKNTG